MQLIFEVSGKGVNQAEVWDTVMGFASVIGGTDLELDSMPDNGIKLYFKTRELDDMRFAIVKDTIEQLAEDLLKLCKEGVAELYKSSGEQIVNLIGKDNKVYALA